MFSLPVSIGEALDKLTILDIKLDKIKDPERNKHCKVEYDILYEQLKEIVSENKFYYDKLKDINESIWDMQDDVRASSDDIGEKCIVILNMNDSRFRIKDILNRKAKSLIQEQKGYPIKKALFLGHQGLGDHVMYIGAVRYLSLSYDEFTVACVHAHNLDNIRSFYADNPKIKVVNMSRDYLLFSDDDNSTNNYKLIDAEMNLSQYSKVYSVGIYKKGGFPPGDIPDTWYNQLDLSPDIRRQYFHVPTTSESKSLYDSLNGIPFIFVQQSASNARIDVIKWDINETLTIDPNTNVYPSDHHWYELANTFVNKPFLSYYDTIVNAIEVHTIESSFYCLASNMQIKATIKKCYNRDGSLNDHYSGLFTN
jgi:hypothetical protein